MNRGGGGGTTPLSTAAARSLSAKVGSFAERVASPSGLQSLGVRLADGKRGTRIADEANPADVPLSEATSMRRFWDRDSPGQNLAAGVRRCRGGKVSEPAWTERSRRGSRAASVRGGKRRRMSHQFPPWFCCASRNAARKIRARTWSSETMH